MPAKNSQKIYVKDGFYHLYNRGVEKRVIFEDQQDRNVFLAYLKEYLSPKDEITLQKQLSAPGMSIREKDKILKSLRLNNFNNEIDLICYCLMPNHFHLLLKQHSENAIDIFMNSLATRYTMYFNRREKRRGPLYEGVYKAVLVETEQQLLHLTHYIHRNPLSLQGVALQNLSEQCSSYANYINLRNTNWVQKDDILHHFSSCLPNLSYKAFVEETEDIPKSLTSILLDDAS